MIEPALVTSARGLGQLGYIAPRAFLQRAGIDILCNGNW